MVREIPTRALVRVTNGESEENMHGFTIGRIAACGVMLVTTIAAHGRGVLAADDEVRLEIGRAFPSITLPRLADGSPASVADFRGEKIILHVFASW